jgi:hypothetical protein
LIVLRTREFAQASFRNAGHTSDWSPR